MFKVEPTLGEAFHKLVIFSFTSNLDLEATVNAVNVLFSPEHDQSLAQLWKRSVVEQHKLFHQHSSCIRLIIMLALSFCFSLFLQDWMLSLFVCDESMGLLNQWR